VTEFRRDQGQENQDRHLPSSKVEDALLSHDGFARRSGRYRGRDERGSQDPRIEKDHQGFDAGGNIGLIGLARRPQQIELLPYARQRRHEFAHAGIGDAARSWAGEPVRLLAEAPDEDEGHALEFRAGLQPAQHSHDS